MATAGLGSGQPWPHRSRFKRHLNPQLSTLNPRSVLGGTLQNCIRVQRWGWCIWFGFCVPPSKSLHDLWPKESLGGH